ncbi:restriction endonuclease subunit S [Aeromonas salmonicida]|uniref:restriction endonuclease subunit S n=1 Tax=Aeromonas salmonicida TaxID=645 RepID=UPI000F76E76C|nr:restriction endonuclease subunit S [Aeromonas salmonicida]RSM33836.1 hypothetical protein C5B77_03245 [Aeromonas salmonicida]
MAITDKPNTTGGQGGSSSQEHGAGVGIMAEQMMQETAGKAIPAGYKQTEVGVIPEDWQLSDIRAISSIPMQNGLFFEPKRKGVGVPLINVADMYASAPINVERLGLFNATLNEINVFRALPGDLFFTRSSVVPSGIAYCNVYVSNHESVVFDSHLIRVRAKQDIIYPKFLYLNCISKHARASLIAEAKTATMTTIDQGAINRCPVLIPPKKEQVAIVTVLSDSDALIGALEQLIAKKQAIKSATMQQLLTGRTRLPAFALRPDGTQKGYKPSELGDIPEDWVVCFLADIANLKNGYAFKSADYCSHGKYCIVTIACVQNGYMNISDSNKLNKLPFDIQSHQILTRGSLLISMTGNVGRVAKVECDDLLLNQRVGLVESKSIDRDFLFYLLRNPTFLADMEEKAVGGAQGNIGKDDILSYSLIKPVCNKEQTAIATILSDMDNELQALTQKLEKARALKQGMMQQLLTGKIRLPLAAGA